MFKRRNQKQRALFRAGRSRSEHRSIYWLLTLIFLLAIGGQVWFMTVAVQNEQFAVGQRLSKFYRSSMFTARQNLQSYLLEEWAILANHTNKPPAERFAALLEESAAESAVIVGGQGEWLYPQQPARGARDVRTLTSEWKQARMLEFQRRDPAGAAAAYGGIAERAPSPNERLGAVQAQVRCLLKADQFEQAREQVEQIAADPERNRLEDSGGRWILPIMQLSLLEHARGESRPEYDALSRLVQDYAAPLNACQRLFLMERLVEYAGTNAFPLLVAERLAGETVDFLNRQWLDSDWSRLSRPQIIELREGLFALITETAIGLFPAEQLKAEIEAVFTQTISGDAMRLTAHYKKPASPETERRFELACGDGFPGWTMTLEFLEDDPFSVFAHQRSKRHILSYCAMTTVMSFALAFLLQSLIRQQRLTHMKNDFVATVTHELKTPLASTRLLIETLLAGRCRSEEQQREYLELIARENQRLGRLIDNFLSFSRMERNKQAFEFSPVDPASAATAAIDAVRERYDAEQCSLSIEIAENLPRITADEDALITVLLNLLDNACKYSANDKRVRIELFEQNAEVCFRVSDHGIGIERRELARIMDRFYQVDRTLSRQCGGAGLGLSIVKFIVDAHGGQIDIESDPDQGSRFTVRIPRG